MSLLAQPKIIVIKRNIEIKKILSSGKKIRTKYGVFFIGNKTNVEHLHFAVLIKKSVGNAVWRNYCKRIVRTYIRNRINNFVEKRQILFVYTYSGKIRYNLLEEEFDKILDFL